MSNPILTLKAIAAWAKSRNAPALVEHVTQRGKTLRGAVLTNVTKAEAQAIDPYTFRKDGGWFIRDKYLDENGQVMGQGASNAVPGADEQTPANAGQDEPLDNQGGSGDSVFFDDENAPKAPYDKLKPAFPANYERARNADTVYDVKEGKRKLAEALKNAFPGVRFSIKKSYGGHTVSWVDGPSKGLVQRVVDHFDGKGKGYLDYHSDSWTHGSTLIAMDEDGKTVNYNLRHLELNRQISTSFAWRILKAVAASGPYSAPYQTGPSSYIADPDPNGEWYRIREDYREKSRFSDVSHVFGYFTVRTQSSGGYFQQYDPIDQYKTAQLEKQISERRYNAHTAPVKRKRLNPGSESTQTPDAGAENVPTASNLLEQNRQGVTTQDPANEAFVRNGAGITGPGAGGPAQQADQPWDDGYPGDDLPDGGPDADGTQDDQPVSGADGRLDGPKGTAGSNQRGGGGGASVPRSPTQVRRNRAAAQGIKTAGGLSEQQAAAEGLPVSWGDKANVHDSLPALLPEQRDDVVQIEDRLINQNQNGILVTNGTGTGKTYTALGTMKRFVKAGRQNVLVVTMNDKIAKDFVKSSRHLGLNLVQLEGTKDNGGPVGQPRQVITTYANFGQNDTLGLIDWDLLVFDESHNLMQGKQSDVTAALSKMRALTGHHGGFDAWAYMRHGVNEPALNIDPKERTEEEQARVSAYWQRMAPLREAWKQNWKAQGPGRAKVLFLSATPFAYAQTLDYAEGYLFHFEEPSAPEDPAKGMRYNSGGSREQFYISNFGYRMRTNKLTQPDANVDVGMMERMFADRMIKSGAMFGRQLTVPFDYDRKFIKVGAGIGQKIEEGLTFLSECNGRDGKPNLGRLSEYFRKNLDYTTRRQLLESIKADGAIGYIRKSMAMGRKVVVFHDYNKGGASNPFSLHGMKGVVDPSVKDQFEQFAKLRPDLVGMQISLPSAVGVLTRAFPDALVFSGKVAKGQRSKQADLFNQDGSGKNLIIVQSDAGATGISFHDTTGKHPRVIVNLGMPNKPAKVRQTEGRIYRVGQASNAIHRYLTIGTSWEELAFANSIAEKAETVDNLAMGEAGQASIKQALIDAYYSPVPAHPSVLDGTGGKADEEYRSTEAKKSEFDQAITLYYSKGKVTDRRNNREGSDWYATPDPVGLMMMKWSGAHVGDRVLEPSAGDGAIARWSPKGTKLDMVEQTESLAARAKLANTDGNVIVGNFEDLHVTNKYESIVMNPPFGVGGKMAMEHVAKAFSHLPYGGRIVALVPTGQMDRRLMDWLSETPEAAVIAKIKLPGCTFERAGTGVMTQIVIIDRLDVEEANQVFPKNITLDHIEDIKTLFERIKEIDVPKRDKRPDEMLAEWGLTVTVDRGKYFFDGPGMKSDAVRKIVINDSAVDYERKKIDGNDVWFWYSRYDVTNRIIVALKKAGVPLLAA